MSKPDVSVEIESEKMSVSFGGGMELQGLHNTALSVIYNKERYDRELFMAAQNYLRNLLIYASDALGKPIGGKHD
jgi:hypothetical protein